MIDVTLNPASRGNDRDRPALLLVKLQAPGLEFNFRASPSELEHLRGLLGEDWTTRRSLHLGQSAGAPVHWAIDGDTVTVMVGHDDETWDIAIQIPVGTVERIVAEVDARNW
jgi:hypothetical protein